MKTPGDAMGTPDATTGEVGRSKQTHSSSNWNQQHQDQVHQNRVAM